MRTKSIIQRLHYIILLIISISTLSCNKKSLTSKDGVWNYIWSEKIYELPNKLVTDQSFPGTYTFEDDGTGVRTSQGASVVYPFTWVKDGKKIKVNTVDYTITTEEKNKQVWTYDYSSTTYRYTGTITLTR